MAPAAVRWAAAAADLKIAAKFGCACDPRGGDTVVAFVVNVVSYAEAAVQPPIPVGEEWREVMICGALFSRYAHFWVSSVTIQICFCIIRSQCRLSLIGYRLHGI